MHVVCELYNIVACLPTAYFRIAMRELAFRLVVHDQTNPGIDRLLERQHSVQHLRP